MNITSCSAKVTVKLQFQMRNLFICSVGKKNYVMYVYAPLRIKQNLNQNVLTVFSTVT